MLTWTPRQSSRSGLRLGEGERERCPRDEMPESVVREVILGSSEGWRREERSLVNFATPTETGDVIRGRFG
jgi:hypothetical protein